MTEQDNRIIKSENARNRVMNIDQQRILNSRVGVGFAQLVGQILPPRIAYPFAYRMADFVAARRGWKMIRTVRTNQWVVSGQTIAGDELDKAVRETVRNNARSIYELNRYLNDKEAINRLIKFDDSTRKLIDLSLTDHAGILIAGIHLGNFDLALRVVTVRGRALILTLPEFTGGDHWQFNDRRELGLEIVPANLHTLRQAISRLRNGGVVMTGLDRPVPGTKYRPRFFGQPSDLPIHHVQLALRAKVPIIVGATIRQADNTYEFLISEPIQMRSYSDRRAEIIANAEAVLEVAEEYIRQAPSQWSIFHPVWPDLIDQAPQ